MLNWDALEKRCLKCYKCGLSHTRNNVVFGVGKRNADIVFVGEGPGEQEDKQGLAFVGPAGQLLTKMLSAIDLPRDRVYICNVVKCRPPRNRQPSPEEMQACIGHLRAQVALVKPRVILLLGATAVSAVLGNDYRITRCHGQWIERKGYSIIATYHPSALLRDESKKRDAWNDLKKVRQRLCELSLYPDLLEDKKNEHA
jgi:DNA polymerase